MICDKTISAVIYNRSYSFSGFSYPAGEIIHIIKFGDQSQFDQIEGFENQQILIFEICLYKLPQSGSQKSHLSGTEILRNCH